MRRHLSLISFVALCVFALFTSCANDPGEAAQSSGSKPAIFPDYTDVAVPVNIAPLDFKVDGAKAVKAVYSLHGEQLLTVTGDSSIIVDEDAWHDMLAKAAGSRLSVSLSVWDGAHPDGIRYHDFSIEVVKDSIDPYIAYRLVDPGYEPWGKMGIFQRSLENFEETPIATNFNNRQRCINCHSFCEYDPNTFMFHQRSVDPGTVIVKDGKLVGKINFKELGRQQQAVYPKWHPSGRYIVFSTCKNNQSFKNTGNIPLEVYDLSGDLFIYDLKTRNILYDDRLNGDSLWESFPTWTPDGKSLVFVSCRKPVHEMPDSSNLVHYDILSIPFDAQTGKLGKDITTLYDSESDGGSASYPRISPDGRYLLFTRAKAGTFPIWHPDADLRILDLRTKKYIDTRILNSSETDSYHSWSSNGRWILFSSRRMDGRHTRLMIGWLDGKGKAHKPFMLPQQDPEGNRLRIQSYNIPEFIKGRVKLSF